LSYDHQ